MTFRTLFSIVSLVLSTTLVAQPQNFEVGSEVHLFGNNVKLRDAPNLSSNTLTLLPIGSKVTIKNISEREYTYNGVSSPWYEVVYNGSSGYVAGGLLSIDKLESSYYPNAYYLFSLGQDEGDGTPYLLIRYLESGALKSELTVSLFDNSTFDISVTDNRGVRGVKDFVIIDKISEACGVNGGLVYVVNDGEQLLPFGQTTEIGDSGMLHAVSSFTFPHDDNGRPGVVIYKHEVGHMEDEETKWYKTELQERELRWDGRKLTPESYNRL